MQYKRGCAVQARMCSTSEDVQYKRGCEVQARMCSTSVDVQYKRVDHQVLVRGGGGTSQKYFPMNESLLLLICQVKTVSSLSQAAKIY